MVEIAPEAWLGVFEYIGIVNRIEDMLPMPLDVSNSSAMIGGRFEGRRHAVMVA